MLSAAIISTTVPTLAFKEVREQLTWVFVSHVSSHSSWVCSGSNRCSSDEGANYFPCRFRLTHIRVTPLTLMATL